MSENLFIKECLYTAEKILIVFNEQMCIEGKSSILIPKNYCLIKNDKSYDLSLIVKGVYCFDSEFVAFNRKKNCSILIDEDFKLCSGIINLKDVSYITNNKGVISGMCENIYLKKYIEQLSFLDFEACTGDGFSIVLKNNSDIKYESINISDFFVLNDGKEMIPYTFSIIDISSIVLKFEENIAKTPVDSILLQTRDKCYTMDTIGNTIKANDILDVKNCLCVKFKNLYIKSYVDDVITLVLNCNSPIIRYDANDFEAYIDNKRYAIKGRKEYNTGSVELYIKNVYNLDFKNEKISLKLNEIAYQYTIDYRHCKIKDRAIIVADYLISLGGCIKSDLGQKKVILTVKFSRDIEALISNLNSNLEISENLDVLTLSSENLFELRMFGKNLINNKAITYYKTEIIAIKNELILSVDISEFDFLSENQSKICFIDFIALDLVENISGARAVTSYSAAIELLESEYIVIDTDDYGDRWSILGEVINKKVIMQLNKSVALRVYGSLVKKTIIKNDLYLIYVNDEVKYNNVEVDLINIEASNVYVNVIDGFYINTESCRVKDFKIL